MHMPVSIGGTTVRKKEGNLVGCLGAEGDEIPKHVGVFQMGHRVPLLCVDETETSPKDFSIRADVHSTVFNSFHPRAPL